MASKKIIPKGTFAARHLQKKTRPSEDDLSTNQKSQGQSRGFSQRHNLLKKAMPRPKLLRAAASKELNNSPQPTSPAKKKHLQPAEKHRNLRKILENPRKPTNQPPPTTSNHLQPPPTTYNQPTTSNHLQPTNQPTNRPSNLSGGWPRETKRRRRQA